MAPTIDTAVEIERDADLVWEKLTDWTHAPRWMHGIDAMAADGPLAVGTELRFRARGKDRPSEIVALEPDRSVTLRSVQGGVTADYTYTVEPIEPGRSRLSLNADCRTSGLWTLYAPLVRWAVRRTDAGQPAALKELIETPKETP